VKLVLFEAPGARARYGVLGPDGVRVLDDSMADESPADQLLRLIDAFDPLRPILARASARPTPLDRVHLLPPVPWPGKILCTTAVYPGGEGARQQLLATLKSPESVVGPGDTVRLPAVGGTWDFVPQAALGLVIRGPARNVAAGDWQRAVFGYTCVIDVMARGDQQFGRDFWLAKSDTLGPLGPCIVTVDEVPDPESLRVRSWQNGDLAQDFLIARASHSIPDQIEFATTVMTLNTADILVCGTSPRGPRPLRVGDRVDVEIDRIGRLSVSVAHATRSPA